MGSPHRKIFLHIDDDDDDRMMVEEVIREFHPDIIIKQAKNGDEGLDLLRHCSKTNELPGLILLDLNMPGMDGKTVLVEIKKNEMLSSVPVVLFTTSSSPLDKLFASKQSVELVTKPTSEAEFIAAVKNILEQFTPQ
jgi:CheY-like chemotaxis protein